MSVSPSDVLEQIDGFSPEIRDAFLESVRDILENAPVAEIEGYSATGEVERIAASLGIGGSALTLVVESVRATYVAGGTYSTRNEFPKRGSLARFRFDVRNLRAENWLALHSSQLVSDITSDQREAIRTVLNAGTRLGRNPRQTALDIVGRMDRVTGRRTGGIIGLTNQQAGFVTNARAQLLSDDPVEMRKYFARERRDQRFDTLVRNSIRTRKPLSVADVDRIVGRYSDRLLSLRGEAIGRTEALTAFNAGQDEAFAQAVESGEVSRENVIGVWRTAGDRRVRHTHKGMNGQKRNFGVPFRSPSGALLMHPGDSSLGAGASEIVLCRCVVQRRIDFLAELLGG